MKKLKIPTEKLKDLLKDILEVQYELKMTEYKQKDASNAFWKEFIEIMGAGNFHLDITTGEVWQMEIDDIMKYSQK